MSTEMTIRFGAGKRINAEYEGFRVATDLGPKAGGDASAPEPYDLFLASLGCCAGVYVRSFCERRNLPIEGIAITQSWERNDKGKVIRITLDISLPADFPEKYRGSVVRAAGQCAVKKTITDPPELVITAG